MPPAVGYADHPCPAGWAFAYMLAEAEDRSGQRGEDSEHDHGHAQEDAPAEQAEQNAREDENRRDNQPDVHAAEGATDRVMFMFGRDD